MREIKFRAWDKKEKEMFFPTALINRDDDLQMRVAILWYEYEIQGDEGDMPIMQYTGLKDKNGKEIYEGDIVRYMFCYEGEDGTPDWDGDKVVISYDSEKATFVTPESKNINLPLQVDNNSYEVIGNIYENKDLVKEEK